MVITHKHIKNFCLSFLLALELLPLLTPFPKLERRLRDLSAPRVGQEDEDGAPEVDAADGLVVVDEGLDRVEQPHGHLVDLVEDEEGLGALAHVAPDPVLQLELVLVQLLVVGKVHGGDEEVHEFAVESLGVETLGDELGDVVLADAGLPVEAEDEGLGRLPLAHVRPEGQRHHRVDEMLAKDMLLKLSCC